MSGLFGVLDLAANALLVNQRGVRVVGHNIANATTPGYSRQRQVLGAAPPQPHPAGHLGAGVEQLSIERVTDGFLQTQLVEQGGATAATNAQAEALARVEQVLNEQGGEGIAAALSGLYRAFSDLAASPAPGQPTEREGVRAGAVSLVDTLHGADAALRDVQRGADLQIQALVPEINSLVERIRELNPRIVGQELAAPANDLRDLRDGLLRELGEKLEIQSFEDDKGALTVLLPSGVALVEGAAPRTLATAPDPSNPFDPGFVRILAQDGATTRDISDEIGSGELGGLLRVRDTLLPAAIRSLDTLAYNLATSVNAVHTAGTGLDGSSGDFFLAPAAVEEAARDLALDPALLANPDAIAAGLGPDPGDNRNALALAALRDAAAALFLPGDPPGPPSGPRRTLLDHAAALVGDVGQQARSLEQARAQQQLILEQLQSRRDEVSGVSIDEEVTNLIQLQAAFQANARVVATVQTLLDDMLAML